VIPHSDRGVQYLFIRCTDEMADSGVMAFVGRTGDSYDNAGDLVFDFFHAPP